MSTIKGEGQSVARVRSQGLRSRLETKVSTGVRVWTELWARSWVKGLGPSQAACTTGQSPLLLFLIALSLCHGTSVTGWQAGCGQGGNRGQHARTSSFHPWLSPPSTQPGWTPTMAAGGVCGAGGVTEPEQAAMSPTGQLCQLWSCRDKEVS